MAIQKIVMPQMGESITNGTITKWHKVPGDQVAIDEILLEISTDKVESEIPSPFEGRLEAVFGNEGDTIDVGVLIAEIQDDPSVPLSDKGLDSGEAAVAQASSPAPPAQELQNVEAAVAATPSESPSSQRRFYTPLVRAMAQEAGIALSELDSLSGSGAGGRVNKQDFLAYLDNRGQKTQSAPATSSSAPAVALAESKTQVVSGDKVEVIPMDNMRKAIAKNMVLSKQTSPHVNSLSEVDLTHLVQFRESFKAEFQKQEGFKITYTPFVAYAIIKALKEYPYVNASIDGDNIVLKKEINLGIAVAVSGNGLVVPVINNADNLNMLGLCRTINDLANKARAKKLSMDDLSGGTFTYTNVGSFGTLLATPVILQPQVGIYASGVIQKRVMVMKNDTMAIRSMMYGTHTYDHRLVDGELGGKFLESIHHNLRVMDPAALF